MKNVKIKKRLKTFLAAGGLSFVLITTGCSSKENSDVTTNGKVSEIESDGNTSEYESIVLYFEEQNDKLDNIIYTENFEVVNEFWSKYFIDAIDIIFYDKEYEGSSFSMLNPEAQQKCIEELKDAATKIDEINPDWQSDLGSIKDITVETYYNLLPKVETLIGTDNYDSIKEILETLMEGSREIFDTIKDNANSAYQKYKSKNSK